MTFSDMRHAPERPLVREIVVGGVLGEAGNEDQRDQGCERQEKQEDEACLGGHSG